MFENMSSKYLIPSIMNLQWQIIFLSFIMKKLFSFVILYGIPSAQEHVTMNLMENLEKNHSPLASIQYTELLRKNAIC